MFLICIEKTLSGEKRMNELKQLINTKEQYEEPKADIILFTCANTLTISGGGDEDEGEWDPVG